MLVPHRPLVGWLFVCLFALGLPTPTTAQEAQPATNSPPFNSLAQAAEPKSLPKAPPKSAAGEAAKSEAPAATPAALTEAEQITRLQRNITADEKQLEELRCELADPTNEYFTAETEFRTSDDQYSAAKAELAKLQETGPEDAVAKLKESLVATERSWKLARERFDLAIQTRKTLQEQISALEGKIEKDRQALDKLMGVVPAAAPVKPATEAAPATSSPKSAETGDSAASTSPTSAPASGLAPNVTTEAGMVGPALINSESNEKSNKALIAAKADADVKQQAVQAAERDVQSVSERREVLEKNISLEQKLLVAGRKKADLANQSRLASEEEYQKKSAEGLMGDELAAIANRRGESERLFQEANREVLERTDRLQALQTELVSLQSEELTALQAAQARQDELLQAEALLGDLRNPFSLRNLFQWLLDHGPTLSMMLTIMYVLHKVMQLSTRRVVELMVQSTSRSAPEESEARINTLAGVFQNAASLTIIIGGAIMMCEEAGIAVAPLMGGAAVLGLAVAFGAQNLIRDYFYGFVILLENQYKINDVLKIGEVSGQVERITLRMTVLRDLEGCVHFIPNGKIDCVSNMTHGWSRAVFDIGISHKEDPDQVMNTLLQLAAELRREATFARLIIDDAEMLGVDKLDSNGLTIKFVIKTRPLKQWAVKRELQRRIKRRFNELGIDLAMPQQFILRDHNSPAEPLVDTHPINLARGKAA
jgi:small-conductance mechanosensitive channel